MYFHITRYMVHQCMLFNICTPISASFRLDGFIPLMALCPNELRGHRFANYILKICVKPDYLFPPVLWAKEPSRHPR